MEWRISFFVRGAEPTPDGWLVTGEAGLGPPHSGDAFSFVNHDDDFSEELVRLDIAEATPSRLRLITSEPVRLRAGHVLGGVTER